MFFSRLLEAFAPKYIFYQLKSSSAAKKFAEIACSTLAAVNHLQRRLFTQW